MEGLLTDQGRFRTDFSKFTSCFVCNTYVTSKHQFGIKTHKNKEYIKGLYSEALKIKLRYTYVEGLLQIVDNHK